jgi:hypothetical protein
MTVGYGRRAADLFTQATLGHDASVDGQTIVIHDKVELGADAMTTLAFVAFLQTCVTQAVPVCWSGRVRGELDCAPLHHLWPPVMITGVAAQCARAWRDDFRYGLCHFRQGPDFLLVKDSRDPNHQVQLVIDHPDLISAFQVGRAPLPVADLSATQQEAVRVLTDENLVYRVGELLLTLPTRMHRWPIPFTAV